VSESSSSKNRCSAGAEQVAGTARTSALLLPPWCWQRESSRRDKGVVSLSAEHGSGPLLMISGLQLGLIGKVGPRLTRRCTCRPAGGVSPGFSSRCTAGSLYCGPEVSGHPLASAKRATLRATCFALFLAVGEARRRHRGNGALPSRDTRRCSQQRCHRDLPRVLA